MSQWERRLSRQSSPAYRLEHELRYALAEPLIRESKLWVDLGCGAGIAAAGALGGRPPAAALLIDVDAEALEEAERNLPGSRVLRADLASSEGVAVVRRAVGEAEAVITCFQTLAYLEDIVPCVELLLGWRERCTVVVSVPNDAFWAIENPHHRITWGQGAVEELQRLLPEDHLVLHQVPLAASAIVGAMDAQLALEPAHVTADRVPSHYVLVFGPHAERLTPLAATRMMDADAQRRVDRMRDSELAVLAARVAELEQAR
jgi:hypothetical protein